jgi:YHS domain-containing protein
MAIDPVCGMEVDERTAVHTSEYQGQTYYFCAPGCKRSFDKNPEQYLTQSDKPADVGHDSDAPAH